MYTYNIFTFDINDGESKVITCGNLYANSPEDAAIRVLKNINIKLINLIYLNKAHIMIVDHKLFNRINPNSDIEVEITKATTIYNYDAINEMIPERIHEVIELMRDTKNEKRHHKLRKLRF